MKPAKKFALVWGLFIQTPLWLYLVYTMISAAHPDRLIWFLFCAYVPSSFFSTILAAIAFNDDK